MADYLTFEQARDGLRKATKIVLDAEQVYAAAIEEAADAEGVYRVKLAAAFRPHRDAGASVQESETLARGEVANWSRERDAAAGRQKLAAEKLEDARDSRRSLWRLIEWSGRMDAANGATPENVPNERWP